MLIPIAVLAVVFAVSVGVSLLYFHSATPPQAYYGGFYWFPVGWFFFIPAIFLVFLAFRIFWWRSWGWWGAGGGRGPGWSSYHDDQALETIRQRFAVR